MKLKADFVSDWLSSLKDILENAWGYNIDGIKDEELPYIYFNAEKKRPRLRRRNVILADTFECPTDLQAGWDRLKDLIETGRDITPHLSKSVIRPNDRDSMLDDWGVHHFHLGEELEKGFVKRTGPLLFALITNNAFYAIGVYHHGAWANLDIIETIHRNWPSAISKFRINGLTSTGNITEQQRLALRAKQGNTFTIVSDGTTYAPIGGGVVSAGYNIQAIIKTDMEKAKLESLQEWLDSQLNEIREELVEHGYAGEAEIEAKLVITDIEYIAILPKYNIEIVLVKK